MPNINGQPGRISNLKLKASYWYVTHKIQLKQGLIVSLIALSIMFYGFSLYRGAMILLVEDKASEQNLAYLPADFIDYQYFHQANKPKELRVLGFEAIGGRDGQYDFVAKIGNSNEKWIAEAVTIQLISHQDVMAEKVVFVYPQTEKYVAFFGQEVNGPTPALKIDKVDWQRYLEFENFAQPRLKFAISDIDFQSARESGIRGELPVSVLNFKMANDTGYSYWSVGVQMILLSGSKVVGANYLALDQFISQETREVEMRWYESLGGVSQVEILPEVDILDPTSYMPVE